ncbi:CHAP domain-containing protein [Streptomyces glaucescens]|uniref:CHAP domain-containing protein n=1 Tax=Streptomyces glaucescens TaxID=1907 RepID=UPI00344BC685
MGNVQGMLTAARKLLGVRENPPGSNNIVTRWYGLRGPWCNMAVSYAAAHSDNLAAVGGKFAYTVAHARSFQKRGRWHYGVGGIRPGDTVFFDWSGSRSIGAIDHVGIVEAVHSDRTITTLEGNTSDAFRRRRRNSACIVGYGRPAYKGGSASTPSGDNILRRGSEGNAVKTLQKNRAGAPRRRGRRGRLHVFPTSSSDPAGLKEVQTLTFTKAHAVLWDEQNGLLWATGATLVRTYRVSGTLRAARLRKHGPDITIVGNGHDIQPCYARPGILLVTDSHRVYSVDEATRAVTVVAKMPYVKSYVRHAGGQAMWTADPDMNDSAWGGSTVHLQGPPLHHPAPLNPNCHRSIRGPVTRPAGLSPRPGRVPRAGGRCRRRSAGPGPGRG